MKSSQELLADLAHLLAELRDGADMPQFQYKNWDKAQQLVGQIQYALKREWMEDNIL